MIPYASARIYAKLRWFICPFQVIEKHISKGGTVIDIGCGFGVFAHYLAAQSADRKVIGIDVAEERIRQAQKLYGHLPNLSFKCANILDFSLPNADVITAVDVLHHIPTTVLQVKLLKSCLAALTPGGKLVIKDVVKRPLWKYWWNLVHDFVITLGQPVLYHDSEAMINLLEKVGFDLQVSEPIHGYPYAHILYIARKPEHRT